MLSTIVATETAFASALIGRDVLFHFQGSRRSLIVRAVNGVAFVTVPFGITDVLFVSKKRAIRAAGIFRRKRLDVCRCLRVANNTA